MVILQKLTDKIAIKYVGNDYKNATNNTGAEIIYIQYD